MKAERAIRIPVPYRVQEGPTCGLYALGMVMDYWHSLEAYVSKHTRTRFSHGICPSCLVEAERQVYLMRSGLSENV
mgnify:CR=1 FL=1